jgi:hypothetical protein
LPCRVYGQTGDLLVQPSEIRSQDGVLDTTLAAAAGMVQLGDVTFPGFLYNNSYLPPLLRARTGDVMRIAFKNDLPDDPSNLHFHGMGVSPRGNGDNVFVHVHPGEEFKYEVKIPVRTVKVRASSGITRMRTALSRSRCSAACLAGSSSTVSKNISPF